jgi:hypothetical protein
MTIGRRFYADYPSSVDQRTVATVAAVLYEVSGQNLSGADDRWLQVHNSAAALIGGEVPIYSYRVRDGETIAIDPPAAPPDTGRAFSTGIVIAWSSTQDVYTAILGNTGPLWAAGRELA